MPKLQQQNLDYIESGSTYVPQTFQAAAWFPKQTLPSGVTPNGGLVIPYTSIQAASMTETVAILTLPILGVVSGAFLVVHTGFSGSGIVTCTCSVGTGGSNGKYLGPTADMTTTGIKAGIVPTSIAPESYSGTTAISLYVTATGANLSALTAGTLTVYVLYGQAGQ